MAFLELRYLFLALLIQLTISIIIAEESSRRNNSLTAYISENNLHGEIYFQHSAEEDIVTVTAFIKTLTTETVENVSWNIRQLPVDYTTLNQRCTNNALGPIRHNLDSMFGQLTLNKPVEFSASTDILSLTGLQGIWQSSIVLELPDGSRACSTLLAPSNTDVRIGKAKFYGPIYGNVYFSWLGITGSETDAIIISDLQRVHKQKVFSSRHKWGIFVTDILESTYDKTKLDCNALQLSHNGLNDLSPKIGELIAGRKNIHRYPAFAPFDLYQTEHTYFVAIYDDIHKDSFLTCAAIRFLPETILKSQIEAESHKANFTFSQRSPFDPTLISYSLSPYSSHLGGIRIHSLPVIPQYFEFRKSRCYGIKEVFNPTNKGIGADAPTPGSKSQDFYAIGDLSGKLGYTETTGWDIFLPLSGTRSIFHRSVVIYKNTETEEVPWLCGLLSPFTGVNSNVRLPVTTAEVLFQYPISGRIIFKQLTDHEYADTAIIVESLIYSDGSIDKDTSHHNWTININPPGKDFYSWQNRCLSADTVFNPFKISGIQNSEFLNYFNYAQLSSALDTLSIAARKNRTLEVTRTLFVHPNLPLSGFHSIIGKSLVIYDENGPEARGNRLACSRILPVNRRKAVIREWFSNGEPASIMGEIEMYQMSEYDNVDVEIKVQGLHDVSEYHIHMVPVFEELQFPCENTTLYDVWDPLKVNNTVFIGNKTVDQYKMGDLSGKYGDWSNMNTITAVHNDSNLQIFSHYSLLGRSLVVQKRFPPRRWACGTIERGYSPSEARELRAIASFHHPLGFVYGYIKMTQLVHVDGSKSDTVIEVNLRHAGKQNRNVTHDHLWFIYVNPVGVDATVAPKITRCTAAGYIWNPNFIQLAAPLNEDLYMSECGPDQPLRCYAGDLSGRLGTISIGVERQVFSDSNLPLEGDISAMGRSIVIFDKNRGNDKFSCANIQPDKDIIKYANIRKPPKFVQDQFLSELREILGAPEWMLTVDNRKTKVLHNGACVQLLFHFKGPSASQLELDFSHLLRTGRISKPTIYNPGYNPPATQKKTLSFQACPTRENEHKKKMSGNDGFQNTAFVSLVILGQVLLLICVSHY